MKVLFKSIVAGVIAAIAACMLSLALARFFDAVDLYIAPTRFLIPVIGRNLPPAVLRRIIPNGPVEGVLLVFFSSLLFWMLVFSTLHFAWRNLGRRRA